MTAVELATILDINNKTVLRYVQALREIEGIEAWPLPKRGHRIELNDTQVRAIQHYKETIWRKCPAPEKSNSNRYVDYMFLSWKGILYAYTPRLAFHLDMHHDVLLSYIDEIIENFRYVDYSKLQNYRKVHCDGVVTMSANKRDRKCKKPYIYLLNEQGFIDFSTRIRGIEAQEEVPVYLKAFEMARKGKKIS